MPQEEPETFSWNPLKIAPKQLVITADKPMAMFTVKNRARTSINVTFRLPEHQKIGISIKGSEPPVFKSNYVKTLKSLEILEVHLNLKPSEMEKLKKGGILKDEEIRVESEPNRLEFVATQVETLILTFTDKVITNGDVEYEKRREKKEEEDWKKEDEMMRNGVYAEYQYHQDISNDRRKEDYSTVTPTTNVTKTKKKKKKCVIM